MKVDVGHGEGFVGAARGGRLAGKGWVGRRALGEGNGEGEVDGGNGGGLQAEEVGHGVGEGGGVFGGQHCYRGGGLRGCELLEISRGIDAAFSGRRLEGALVRRVNSYSLLHYCSCGLPPSAAHPHL